MTLFEITYTIKGSEEPKTFRLTEKDEKKAVKTLRAELKNSTGTIIEDIIGVEVIRENEPATKAQEREALEEIRAIIESLGEGSYLATAFDGCIEDAENNIEDDAAYSMKGRWESAVQESYRQGNIITDLRHQLAEKDEQIARLEDRALTLEAKTLSADDLCDCSDLIQQTVFNLSEEVEEAAANIVRYADNPASEEFQQAVTTHRAMSRKLDYYKQLNRRVNAARQ
jgi:hypothetical protein